MVKLKPKKVIFGMVSTKERDYLFPDEVEKLIKAAKLFPRHGLRNATLILVMFRHGLRSIEAISLRWDNITFKTGHMHVHRAKNGRDSVHPIRGQELRWLRQLKRDYPDCPYVFTSERKSPLATRTVRGIVAKAGVKAELNIKVHSHMLRHACGHYLASKGHDTRALQDYLGHKNIHNTVRYTQLAANRFDDFWKD